MVQQDASFEKRWEDVVSTLRKNRKWEHIKTRKTTKHVGNRKQKNRKWETLNNRERKQKQKNVGNRTQKMVNMNCWIRHGFAVWNRRVVSARYVGEVRKGYDVG